MTDIILRASAKFLVPLFLVVAVLLLWRGHNDPGGGFAAGLIVTAALSLHLVAYGREAVWSLLRDRPAVVIGAGLVLVLISGFSGLAAGEPFMTGQWIEIGLGPLGTLKLGTPLLFDLGVAIVVAGMGIKVVMSVSEE